MKNVARSARKQAAYKNKVEAGKKALIQTLLVAVVLVGVTTVANAQGGAAGGAAAINEATTQVTSYFDPATKLIYAIGAVVGLVGGVKVYGKWNSGDQDTQKTAMSWFGSCIFLVIIATVLRAFFL
ncbi:DUF4134 domain-containing protein [Hymenobacter defluvii]|uniref:DUF4134 domain-containing protein n=1 Tax=Hymenobacter defluvii TaxID=2054411 RepID=A0ABS3TJB7_9BACT|nr:DUF4134 domain-containing protein [Hymenobacter defluvii]MBO3273503.1 DUF4134 domain-containing protein [Hymenobacter defluvii]